MANTHSLTCAVVAIAVGTVCLAAPPPTPSCHDWPQTCPGTLPTKMKQTWMMNASTVIMPCNDSGYTDPQTTLGWGVVDFDWSNGKGTGTADGWAKHQPMDDEEMLFKQVQMTTAATPGTTVWVYRNTVYGYPWYTDVRIILEDPAYEAWFFKFKPEGPWTSPKCDSAQPDLCSDFYHSQEQSPGYPHGDGDCTAPGCDCGKVPCGFYIWNHSSTVVVNGQSFQDWFVHTYMLNKVGMSDLVSGFFWDDVWNPECNIHDQVKNTCEDMGLTTQDLIQLTADYQKNMGALRAAVLDAGKFSWQMLWTGGSDDEIGSTCPGPLVNEGPTCATSLRSLCTADSPSQTRALMYAFSPGKCRGDPSKLTAFDQDLANFLLIRGEYSWLGHGWLGCSRTYDFRPELNLDYGIPSGLCTETANNSGVFIRDFSKSTVQMDCNKWNSTIVWK